MINFIRYDTETGYVNTVGFMDPLALSTLIGRGEPYIKLDNIPKFDRFAYQVNLSDKSIVPYTGPKPLVDTPMSIEISDRQFFQQTAKEGYISKEDALKAVQSGFVPPIFQSEIDKIANEDERFDLQMIVSGSSYLSTSQNAFIELIKRVFNKNTEQIDIFFKNAQLL
jgi:hypothetical protein